MKVKFNKERLYEALQSNGINSVRELCGTNDSVYYNREFVCRKTIERACQDGEITNRSLRILAGALHCTSEFLMGEVVKGVKDENVDQCIVYMSDNREILVKGRNLHWAYEKDDNGKYQCRFYADKSGEYDEVMVAEFCAAVCYGIVRVEGD